MHFVVDASVTASWTFQDDGRPYAGAAAARLRSDEASVPGLWWFEVKNTLVVNERRGRISEADTAAFLDDLGRFAITLDRVADDGRMLILTRQHRLTVQDAAHLELARREGVPLATLDLALQRAAVRTALPLLARAG